MYEVGWDYQDWKVHKRRADKCVPNVLFTVMTTLYLVLDPIRLTTLVED
jgi:hypothetical protein